jgi:hypothetical protein
LAIPSAISKSDDHSVDAHRNPFQKNNLMELQKYDAFSYGMIITHPPSKLTMTQSKSPTLLQAQRILIFLGDLSFLPTQIPCRVMVDHACVPPHDPK